MLHTKTVIIALIKRLTMLENQTNYSYLCVAYMSSKYLHSERINKS